MSVSPFIQRMHQKEYDRYLSTKEQENFGINPNRIEYQAQQTTAFEQKDFNRIVLDFMINGMHPPTLLTDPSFDILLNGWSTFF